MANWAYTHANVEGKDPKKIKELYSLLKKYEKDGAKGHSPLHNSKNEWDGRYFFNVQMLEDESKVTTMFSFTTETKWDDPRDTLKFWSLKYGVKIETSFQELGNGLYGEAIYENGEEQRFIIEDNEQLDYDENGDPIDPNSGEVMESEYDHYDEIIEQKRKLATV